jgi:hypothetical protein
MSTVMTVFSSLPFRLDDLLVVLVVISNDSDVMMANALLWEDRSNLFGFHSHGLS